MAEPARLACILALALSGCVPAPTGMPGPDACGAPGLQGLVGKDVAAVTVPPGTRVIYPGTPVTEDYSPTRLNLDVDGSGRITGVWCG